LTNSPFYGILRPSKSVGSTVSRAVLFVFLCFRHITMNHKEEGFGMAEGNAVERIVLTPEGKEKLERELNELKTVRRVEIAKEIENARSFGDLTENAEYDEAKNAQGRMESRIRELEDMLRNAEVVEQSKQKDGKVGMGSVVTVFDMEYGEVDTYTIVGATEADMKALKVSTESPIGKALMGASVGDTVDVPTPGGIIQLRIDKIN
jgi:transcription elongation factor GreA